MDQRQRSAKTVLYVTDHQDMTDTLEAMFKKKGFGFISEKVLRDAVNSARIVDPSVIILDLNLLRGDWAALICELSIATHAQILSVIPRANSWDIFSLYEAGAKECLLRPVSPMLLLMKTTALMVGQEWSKGYSRGLEPAYV